MVVQLEAFAETWIWKDLPYAASQLRTTWLTSAVSPRSIWIHCGSLNALDQRVPLSPSTAAEAGKAAPSLDDAVVGFFRDNSVAARAGCAGTVRRAASSVSAATKAGRLTPPRRRSTAVIEAPRGLSS